VTTVSHPAAVFAFSMVSADRTTLSAAAVISRTPIVPDGRRVSSVDELELDPEFELAELPFEAVPHALKMIANGTSATVQRFFIDFSSIASLRLQGGLPLLAPGWRALARARIVDQTI
jgi:hypothetical protein